MRDSFKSHGFRVVGTRTQSARATFEHEIYEKQTKFFLHNFPDLQYAPKPI